MINMVVDQRAFGPVDRTLNRQKLGGNVGTGRSPLDHGDDMPQMPFDPLQPGDDGGVTSVLVRF